MEDVKFEWCFEIGSQVTDLDIDGAKSTDVFEITDRKVDEDGQWFNIVRLSDGATWEEVAAGLLERTRL